MKNGGGKVWGVFFGEISAFLVKKLGGGGVDKVRGLGGGGDEGCSGKVWGVFLVRFGVFLVKKIEGFLVRFGVF